MRVRGGPPAGYSKVFPAIGLIIMSVGAGTSVLISWVVGNLANVNGLSIETSDNGAAFVLQSTRTVAQIRTGSFSTPNFTVGHNITFRMRILDVAGNILDDIQPLPAFLIA